MIDPDIILDAYMKVANGTKKVEIELDAYTKITASRIGAFIIRIDIKDEEDVPF